jgi:hypothetical protein
MVSFLRFSVAPEATCITALPTFLPSTTMLRDPGPLVNRQLVIGNFGRLLASRIVPLTLNRIVSLPREMTSCSSGSLSRSASLNCLGCNRGQPKKASAVAAAHARSLRPVCYGLLRTLDPTEPKACYKPRSEHR